MSDWEKEGNEDQTNFQDLINQRVYRLNLDFDSFDDILDGFDKSVRELIKDGRLIEVKSIHGFDYSYEGAADASLSGEGYGELKFNLGHTGAGVAFRTFQGDGEYSVYAEKCNGSVLRIYVNLI
jgi:hypothetical protein